MISRLENWKTTGLVVCVGCAAGDQARAEGKEKEGRADGPKQTAGAVMYVYGYSFLLNTKANAE